MFHETRKAERNQGSFKAYVVPAAILAGWITMVGGLFASLSGGPSLHSSIETVLSEPSASQPSTPTELARR